jgi:hypothetical protein
MELTGSAQLLRVALDTKRITYSNRYLDDLHNRPHAKITP